MQTAYSKPPGLCRRPGPGGQVFPRGSKINMKGQENLFYFMTSHLISAFLISYLYLFSRLKSIERNNLRCKKLSSPRDPCTPSTKAQSSVSENVFCKAFPNYK